MLALLAREPGQTVSSLALRLGFPLAVASQYLRTLEARSLLVVRRNGRQVQYRLKTAAEERHPLVQSLRSALRPEGAKAIETVFRLCTAFTHPRRIRIFAALRKEPQALARLQVATGISVRSLQRHLEKLKERGFVRLEQSRYFAAAPSGKLAHTLVVLAEQ